MLLTITLNGTNARDLGFLLHKNPARAHHVDLAFGAATVFYSAVANDVCTAVLMLEVDPVELVRGKGESDGAFTQYVNDRPFVASSFVSVALSRIFGTAMSGTSKERQELTRTPLSFEVHIPVVPCRGGPRVARDLFEPLGYAVEHTLLPLDTRMPEWGSSRYIALTLRGTTTLASLLTHLYVLLPVLDDDKHYYVGDDEVEKLLRRGEGWLAAHPQRELIAHRYLKHRRSLTEAVMARLLDEGESEPDEAAQAREEEEAALEDKVSLNEQRLTAVAAMLQNLNATSVIDLGCGEGKLLRTLVKNRHFKRIVGVDVSHRSLGVASDRLHLDRMHDQKRVQLMHGSIVYRDARFEGFDAAAIIEVIEHLDPPRLSAFERVVFEKARPKAVVLTTPNAEYNVRWESLPAGKFRHKDHRFEWTRAQLEEWASAVAERFGYQVRFEPVGPVDEVVGAPTQMAVFER